MSNGQRERQAGEFKVTVQEIVEFIEKEIKDSAAVRSHLERDSRSRRTWAAGERAYEKILNWILQHKN
jgi:hypothetical protein